MLVVMLVAVVVASVITYIEWRHYQRGRGQK